MMKLLKSMKMIVALVLTLTMIALVPLNTAAAANNGKYVSEVYVAYGKDAEEAKKTLEDKGFTPVEGNLNDGGKTYAMMGYKTTDDIRDSITDLAVMNMHGGYSVEDYKSFLKAQKTQVAEFLGEFMSVIGEYRQNLKKNKSKALIVHDILNNYIDDDTGMKMGDLLNSETLQDQVGIEASIDAANPGKLPDLITILMQGNAQVIKSVEVLLSMTSDTNENSWIDRFAELDYDSLMDKVEEERPELNTETKRQQYLDNLYEDDAFAFACAMSELRSKLYDYEEMVRKASAQTDKWTEFMNFLKSRKNKDDYKALLESDEWLSVSMIYEGLNAYEGGNFKQGELLGYFLEKAEDDDVEYYYPIMAALSDGQRYGLPFIGLENLFCYAFTDEEGWKKIAEDSKVNFGSPEDISVYAGIDRDIYKDDGSVAFTDSAMRANAVNNVGTSMDEDNRVDLLARITQISWAATGTAIAAAFASEGISRAMRYSVGHLDTPVFEMLEDGLHIHHWDDEILKAIDDAEAFAKFKAKYSSVEKYGTKVADVAQARFAVSLCRIIEITTIVLAVITAVLTIIDLMRDKSVEQLPIPKYLVDHYSGSDGGSYTLNYKAVECNRSDYFDADHTRQTGNSADINADEGKQWLVLYASKNSRAGKPLEPDFILTKYSSGNSFDTDKYNGNIHLIGEKGAVNLAGSAYKNYSTFSTTIQFLSGSNKCYLFYKLSNDVKTYDESAGNMTASAIGSGMVAVWGFGGLIIGGALGAVIAIMINKNKKKKETV